MKTIKVLLFGILIYIAINLGMLANSLIAALPVGLVGWGNGTLAFIASAPGIYILLLLVLLAPVFYALIRLGKSSRPLV